MLLSISIIIAAGLAVLLILLTSISWWFLPLIIIGAYVVVLVLYMVIAWIIATITLAFNKDIKPHKFYGFIIHITCRFLVTIFNIKIITEGLDLIKKDKPLFFVCNHQSNFDPIIKLSVIDDYTISLIMKDEVMNIPIVGKWLYASGYYPLNRNNDREALKTVKKSIKRIEDGFNLLVYPEGTRSKTTELGEYKDGTFKIPQKSQASICVVLIDNIYNIKKNLPFKQTKVLFRVCEVIPYSEIEGLTTHEIRTIVEEITRKNLQEVRKSNLLENNSYRKHKKYEKC